MGGWGRTASVRPQMLEDWGLAALVPSHAVSARVRQIAPSARFDHQGKLTPPSIDSVLPVMYSASSLRT